MNSQLQDQVIRYVRDELDLTERTRFEQQVAEDKALQSLVAFEQQLQKDFKRPVAEIGDPDFSQIEGKLGAKPLDWLKPAVTVAFACSLAVAVFLGPVQGVLEPSFETLTAPEVVQQDRLRVTLADPAALSQFASEYEFEVVASFPGLNTFDLAFATPEALKTAQTAMLNHDQVRNTEVVKANNQDAEAIEVEGME